MTLRLFTLVSAAAATRRLYRYLEAVHLGAIAAVVAFGGMTATSLSAVLFILVSASVNRWPRYRASPFALVTSVVVAVYFVIPLVFLAVSGPAYEFGTGLADVPRRQTDYHESAPLAVLFLGGMLAAGAAGLGVVSSRREPGAASLVRGIRPGMRVGLLGIVVLAAAYEQTAALLQIRLTGTETGESLWQFIFFDAAYLILLPIVVATRLTKGEGRSRLRTEWQFILMLAVFFAQATFGSTSKGFIVTLFLMSFVIPLSYFRRSRTIRCFVPSGRLLLASVLLAALAFLVVQQVRVAVFTGEARSAREIVVGAFTSGGEHSIASLVPNIGYRLSAAVDRYVLIFDAHLYRGHSAAAARDFATYLAKSLANLTLPGTPYVEAYVPSSNLLPALLFKTPLFGEASKAELIRSLNTQPFTLFGVATILAGAAAPLLVFAAAGLLSFAYRIAPWVSVRIALIYLALAALHAYGAEVVVANALHMGVSLAVFIALMRVIHRMPRLTWQRRVPVRP